MENNTAPKKYYTYLVFQIVDDLVQCILTQKICGHRAYILRNYVWKRDYNKYKIIAPKQIKNSKSQKNCPCYMHPDIVMINLLTYGRISNYSLITSLGSYVCFYDDLRYPLAYKTNLEYRPPSSDCLLHLRR